MAYTPAPENQTYSTHRLPAVHSLELRPFASNFYTGGAISTDPGTVNILSSKEGKEVYGYTRPPLVGATIDSGYINRTVRGYYVWEKSIGTTYYFCVVDARIYSSDNGTTWTNVKAITSGEGAVSFTEFISSTATKSLIICDGTSNIYQFTTNAAPTTIAIGFTPIPYIVFLDGYLFTAKAGTGDIYNCNLDDPATWTAGDFISSELYPDDVRALCKVNNYLLALGSQGCEFFYDAANPTASPLARYQEGALPFGIMFQSSLATSKNSAVFLANNNDGELVLRAVENFKFTDVPCGWLMEYIAANLTETTGGSGGHKTDSTTVRACFLRFRGDLYYVLATQPFLASYGGSAMSNWIDTPTFAFNFTTGLWTELRITKSGVNYPFTFVFSSSGKAGKPTNYVAGITHSATNTVVPCYATIDEGGGSVSTEAITTYLTDNISVELRTPRFDFGTLNSKMMNRFGVLATTSTPNATASVSIQWSDDNYGTWTTARSLDIKDSTDFPFLTQLGRFRQRSFRITYSGTAPLWFKGLEVDINKAQQ